MSVYIHIYIYSLKSHSSCRKEHILDPLNLQNSLNFIGVQSRLASSFLALGHSETHKPQEMFIMLIIKGRHKTRLEPISISIYIYIHVRTVSRNTNDGPVII